MAKDFSGTASAPSIGREYHKIETLFERDGKTFVVNPAVLKASVLATIREWDVTEKIDGTNIRVMLSAQGDVTFGGRTDAAQIPADLVQYLMRTFTVDALKAALWLNDEPVEAVLCGEGYGPGIQNAIECEWGAGYKLVETGNILRAAA